MVTIPWVIAHRGASGYRPEHTIAAYELALRQGVDAVEPDLVPTRDGVLVVRHENEISATTDIADHPEFADRRTTRVVDGQTMTGWFTEDFTWAELSRVRARERLPDLRPANAAFDGLWPILRFSELLDLLDTERDENEREVRLVAELKHPTYFARRGLSLVELFENELRASERFACGEGLVIESFDRAGLMEVVRRGLPGAKVFLMDASTLASFSPRHAAGNGGPTAIEAWYDRDPDPSELDGVSLDATFLMGPDGTGHGAAAIVEAVRDHGLSAWCWTLRAENSFLTPAYRRGDDPAEWGDWRGQFQVIHASGVEGVFADQPDLVLSLR